VEALVPMLADPVRLVRIDAASALADVSPQLLGADQRARLAKGLDEYIATQRYNADRPEGRSNLGTLYAELGQYDKTQAELKQALALEPAFAPAAIDLADLDRARGDEQAAEATLRAALKRNPRNASLHFALGLSLVRQKRIEPALAELAEAARLDPSQPRYAYVYGVALNGTGKPAEAIRVLADAHRRFTGYADILVALATMERDRGQREAALKYARTLVELAPDDPQAKALVQQLER
jgi:tetratricopeptide (TPR) repeat protein